jgi:outer membrane protein TolC
MINKQTKDIMTRVITIFIFIFYISFGNRLHAQNSDLVLSLTDAIRIAQQQSPDALMAKHKFRSSYWKYRSFRATYLPGVQIGATLPNLNRSIEAITMPDGSSDYVPRSYLNYSFDLSVNQRIGLTGGEVFVNSSFGQTSNYYTDTTTKQFLSNMVNIGIRQPVFAYNPYKWEKRIEPLKYDEAKRIYLENNEQVAIVTINRFFNLLTAQIEKEIAETNYHNYDTLYKIAKGRYNLGKIAENELLQLELNLLKAESALELSELNYNNNLFLFKSYLRLKDNYNITLIPPVVTSFFDISLEKAIAEAKNNTSTGLQFKRRILEAESQVNQAKMNGRFDAQIYAQFGLTQTSDNIKEAYRYPLDQERVTIGITLPLLDWGKARGNIKMAESNRDLVETSIEQEKIDFEQNIYLQVMQFSMQKKQLYIAAKSDTVAKKRFEVTHKRYMIGKVNDVLELNNAQIDNDNAQKGYITSLKSYWINYYKLRKMTLYDFENNLPIIINFDKLINK